MPRWMSGMPRAAPLNPGSGRSRALATPSGARDRFRAAPAVPGSYLFSRERLPCLRAPEITEMGGVSGPQQPSLQQPRPGELGG